MAVATTCRIRLIFIQKHPGEVAARKRFVGQKRLTGKHNILTLIHNLFTAGPSANKIRHFRYLPAPAQCPF
ncbi:hypothetical protein SBV1_1610019 [Verrucomicrobia bacterium]|nr:hypothetical protein SBV1_1610019 [Verrucomicrobiota bacterium]